MHPSSGTAASAARPGHLFQGLGAVSPEALAAAGVTPDVPDLVEAFLGVMHRVKGHLADVAATHGLSPPMAMTLRLLDEPRSQREIADAIGCDPSYVTGLIDRLEELGVVERTSDPSDRRVKRIVLTPAGEQMRRNIAIGLLRDAPVAAGLDATQRTDLLRLLRAALATEGSL